MKSLNETRTPIHTCHKLLTEICEILQIFRGDLMKFCEIFYENYFQAYTSKFKAINLMH